MTFMRALFGLLCAFALALPAQAQKRGGTLVVTHIDSPPSPSVQEEGTSSVLIPFMALFNNLVMYDQHKEISGLDTIVPELATAWAWNADNTVLTFALRQGVRWHDGTPFTAADVE